MENKKDNNDIEELNLNDVEIEIKPQDINLEIKSVNPQSSLTDETIENLDFNEDNSSLENDQSVEQKGLSESASPSSDNSSVSDQGDKIFDDDSNASSDSQSTASSSSNDEISPSANDEKGSDNIDNDFDSKNNESAGKDNSDESQKSDSGDLQKNNQNKEDKNLNQKDKNTNKKDNNPSNDKNLDNKQNVDKNQNNKKDDVNKEPKKERNEDKNKIGNQGDKKPSGSKPSSNLKDRWNNRPKSPKDFANRAKNGIKNGAKNSFNNSKAGRAINKGKKAVEAGKKAVQGTKKTATAVKTAVSFFSTPAGWITLAVVAGLLLILVIAIMVPSMFASGSPLLGGEVSNEENYSKYSEVDQETIDKLKDITDDYANGDPALAMVTVVYPYIEELQDGNVSSLRGKTNVEQQDGNEEQDDENSSQNNDNSSQNNQESQDDTTDLEDNQNDITADDPYLELFRKWTYRNKFKNLLKETEKGEESYIEHLKNSYFGSDKGYKEMFDGCEDEEALADAIIDDLLELKEDFEGYFFEVCVTNTSYESVGQVQVSSEVYKQMMQGNVLIELLDTGCGSTKSCSTYKTLSLDEYVKGVVYEEINGRINKENIEQVKAQMVAVKSYTLSRRTPEQTTDGTYVIKMRWSTADQDYCDYINGCEDVPENYGYNNVGDCLNNDGSDKCKHFGNHGPASQDVKDVLNQAWEDTKNYYVLDSDGVPRGSYMASCEIGKCMSQEDLGDVNGDYISMLTYFYSDYVVALQEGEYTSAYVGTTSELCGENVNGGIPDSEFKFYYQTNYPDVAFCGATDWKNGCPSDGKNTICTSGCGVTSYAMVIATLSDTENTFDPIAANEEATSSGGCAIGGGTNNNLFTNIANNHSGFTYENIPVTLDGAQQVLEALKNGGLVVANVQASSPFTHGGHWIVIRGITEEGMVKVADPNSSTITTTEVYDINDFINNNWLVDSDGTTHSWFAIYGPKSEEFKYAAAGVATGTLGYPVEGVTGCDASDYPYYSSGSYHGGTDMNRSVGAKEGMNILAADGGTVKTVKNLSFSYGSHVIIDHGNGYTTLYAHMQKGSIVVKEGDLVSKGQLIGKLGSTGNSTGPHLHIELRINNSHTNTLNPCEYIGKNKPYVSK